MSIPCPKCGAAIADGRSFCLSCGAYIGATAPAAGSEAAEVGSSQPAPTSQTYAYGGQVPPQTGPRPDTTPRVAAGAQAGQFQATMQQLPHARTGPPPPAQQPVQGAPGSGGQTQAFGGGGGAASGPQSVAPAAGDDVAMASTMFAVDASSLGLPLAPAPAPPAEPRRSTSPHALAEPRRSTSPHARVVTESQPGMPSPAAAGRSGAAWQTGPAPQQQQVVAVSAARGAAPMSSQTGPPFAMAPTSRVEDVAEDMENWDDDTPAEGSPAPRVADYDGYGGEAGAGDLGYVTLCTAELAGESYDLIDVLARRATASLADVDEGFAEAFEALKRELRKGCASLGGDAVIQLRFEREREGNRWALYGFGTVVRRRYDV